MVANHARDPYIFADFTFDPVAGTLQRGHQDIPLARQPALVLQLLLDNAGQVVTREQMIAAVWGDGTTVVYADGLNFCMRQIRQALGETARQPILIETFPKRGYRFAGQVSRDRPAVIHQPPSSWIQMPAIAALMIVIAVSAPVPIERFRVARPTSTLVAPLTPIASAILRQADVVLQLTIGSIEAHLSGGVCPWPRYLSARRRSA